MSQKWPILPSKQLLLLGVLGIAFYLSEDVGRHPGGHEDGAQLLQQAALVHGLLTAG